MLNLILRKHTLNITVEGTLMIQTRLITNYRYDSVVNKTKQNKTIRSQSTSTELHKYIYYYSSRTLW